MPSFLDKLQGAWERSGSLLCVGLDPNTEMLPAPFASAASADPTGKARAVLEFCLRIIDAVHPFVCAFKPQYACFAALGPEGISALRDVIAHAREIAPELPVILDAKKADIGVTSRMYAVEAFDVLGADAVTANPYMGFDALEPFLERPERGVFVLCRTSNPGAGEVQELLVSTERGELPLYLAVAFMVSHRWNINGNCGLVVGATNPAELSKVRAEVGELPILVPGVGAQGGDLRSCISAGLDVRKSGLVVNVSRAVLYAGRNDDFDEAARQQAKRFRDEINRYRGVSHG
ncbi:MAG: orotidine-5'-phosphate decarboxylase [Armatimonadota bacterium]